MSPNIIETIGYSQERLHSGMIAYLCELYNGGIEEPLTSFLNTLGGAQAPKKQPLFKNKPNPIFEWENIDLMIFDGEAKACNAFAMIEMKVDSHEHLTYKNKKKEGEVREKTMQTKKYSSLAPSCHNFWFVTLGIGEFYDKPASKMFDWIKLPEFFKAIDSIQFQDRLIDDWKTALHNEIRRREEIHNSNPKSIVEKRPHTWNANLFGRLKEEILKGLGKEKLTGKTPRVYLYGPKPDSILNFRRLDAPYDDCYAEINSGGMLSRKMSFKPKDVIEQARRFKEVQNHFKELLEELKPPLEPLPKPPKNPKKTKTVLQFKTGLELVDTDDRKELKCNPSFPEVCNNILAILKVLMSNNLG